MRKGGEARAMAWVKIDDHITQNPKIAAAGPLAMAMHLAAICYCNRELTDGFVPRAIARTLLDWEYVDAEGKIWTVGTTCGMRGEDVTNASVIPLLVDAGLWEVADGGYRVHDYLDYQQSKDVVLAGRDATLQRVRAHRERKRNGGTGGNGPIGADADHGDPDLPGNAVSNGPVTALQPRYKRGCNGVSNGDVTLLKNEELRRENGPPPVPFRPAAPAIAPAYANGAPPPEAEGVVVVDYRKLMGDDSWQAITETIERIDATLTPSWFGRELRAQPAGLDRDRLMLGMRHWRTRIEAKARANDRAADAHKIVHWRSIAALELRDALEEVRYAD